MDCNCCFNGEVYTLAKKEKEVKDKGPELRVDLINDIVDKLEDMLIEWQEKHNVSIWELDNVILRLHYDIESNAHMLMHSTEDKSNVDFHGSKHIYR